jgi:chromosome segregation ATPase
MQGRDSVEPNVSLSLQNSEAQVDLQAPKFYETENDLIDVENTSSPNTEESYDVETSECPTQLEELQQLLDIANQNEKNAKKNLAEMTTKFEASKCALEEMKLRLDKSKAQAKSAVDNLQTTIKSLSNKHNTAVDFSETLRRERDRAVYLQKEEESKNVTLQLNIDELKRDFEQLAGGYENKSEENKTLKKVILKQNGEIERLNILLENNKPFPPAVSFGGPTFFRAINELPRQPEIKMVPLSRSMHKDW